MTHIPIMVKPFSEVIPSANIDREISKEIITICYHCGCMLFYQVVTYNYEGSENATDICIYCAVCGEMQGGIIHDPFDEIECFQGETFWWKMLDWNTMPKAWKQLPKAIKEKIREVGLAPKGRGGNSE